MLPMQTNRTFTIAFAFASSRWRDVANAARTACKILEPIILDDR